MKALELKDIVGYLPYKLEIKVGSKILIMGSAEFESNIQTVIQIENIKPLLLPLSMLNQEIEVNGERFIPIELLDKETYIDYELSTKGNLVEKYDYGSVILEETGVYPYWIIQKLYEWHFDLHSLIDKNLAIDITTLNKTTLK